MNNTRFFRIDGSVAVIVGIAIVVAIAIAIAIVVVIAAVVVAVDPQKSRPFLFPFSIL